MPAAATAAAVAVASRRTTAATTTATTTVVPATAMATSKAGLPRIFVTAVLTTVAVAVATAGCQSYPAAAARTGHPGEHSPGTEVRLVPTLFAQPAPASSHLLTLPDPGAGLALPPAMHRVPGHRGAVS